MTTDLSVVISRPGAEVWAHLTDWSRAHEWMGRVEGLSVLDPDRPLSAGTLLTARFSGDEDVAVIVRFEPCRALAIRWQRGLVAVVDIYLLEANGSDTKLTLERVRIDGSAHRWFRVPALRLVGDRHFGRRELKAFKRLVESSDHP